MNSFKKLLNQCRNKTESEGLNHMFKMFLYLRQQKRLRKKYKEMADLDWDYRAHEDTRD